MRGIAYRPRCWAAVAIAITLAGRSAAAQQVLVQADGSLNVGVTQTTRDVIQSDPMAQEPDVIPESVSSLFTEIRPGLYLQSGSPRLTWRVTYVFSGSFKPDGGPSYSNQATAGLVDEITKYSSLAMNAAVAQGGSAFLLSQAPAAMGSPEIRAPGNPNLINATLAESFTSELGRQVSLQQNLLGNLSAPQDDFAQRNTALTGTLGLSLASGRDDIGLELRGGIANLRPLRSDDAPYNAITSALVARWNHDFSPAWNGLATAGVEEVYAGFGSRPLALLPTGSALVRYTLGDITGALDFSHGSAVNIQVGTVSLTDKATARGVISLDPRVSRLLSFSAGVLHNASLGDVSPAVAAGSGNAIQGDAEFTTAVARNVLVTARYTLAYQFGQAAGLSPTRTQILFVGITGSINNSKDGKQPMPTRGGRVDRSDAAGFPVVPGNP
jgi:hypothetical protein